MKSLISFQHPANKHVVNVRYPWLWSLLFGVFYWIYQGIWKPVLIWVLAFAVGLTALAYTKTSIIVNDATDLKNTIMERIDIFRSGVKTAFTFDKSTSVTVDLKRLLADLEAQKTASFDTASDIRLCLGEGYARRTNSDIQGCTDKAASLIQEITHIKTLIETVDKAEEAIFTIGKTLETAKGINDEILQEVISPLLDYAASLDQIDTPPTVPQMKDLVMELLTLGDQFEKDVNLAIATAVQMAHSQAEAAKERRQEIHTMTKAYVFGIWTFLLMTYALFSSRIVTEFYLRKGWSQVPSRRDG